MIPSVSVGETSRVSGIALHNSISMVLLDRSTRRKFGYVMESEQEFVTHSGPALAAAATMRGSTGGLLSDCFFLLLFLSCIDSWL